jgi:hypothetical protein
MMGPAVSREAKEFIDIVMGPAESMQFIDSEEYFYTTVPYYNWGAFPVC